MLSRNRSKGLFCGVVGIFLLGLASISSSQPLSIESVLSLPRVTEFDASAEADLVSYSLRTLDGDHFTSDIYLLGSSFSAPQRLTANPGNDRFPSLSPDGSHLAYIAETPSNPAELRVMNLKTRMVKQLGDLRVTLSAPRWLPQGDRLVFVARARHGTLESELNPSARPGGQSTPIRVTENRLGWRNLDGMSPHLFMLDTQAMTVVDLTPDLQAPLADTDFQWDLSPSGTKVAYSAIGGAPPYRRFQHDLFMVDLNSRQTVQVINTAHSNELQPRFSGDQALIFGLQQTIDIDAEFRQLMILNLISGDISNVFRSDAIDPDDWSVSRGGDLLMTAVVAGQRQVFQLDQANGVLNPITSSLSLSQPKASGKQLLAIGESFDTPPHLLELTPSGNTLKTLHHTEASKTAVRWQRFVVNQNDGTLESWLVLPTERPPRNGWPLLVLLHGGPYSSWLNSHHPRWNAALFAAQGYAVLLPEFRGSSGHGQAFAKSILGDPATAPAKDVDILVDALQRRAWVNSEPPLLAGPSYGGYLAAWMLTESKRYRSAIIQSGVFDLAGQYASDVTWTRDTSYGASPWSNWRHLIDRSPLARVEKIDAPVLLLHGESDIRVPVTQSLAFHEGLINNGIRSRLVLFPNAGHVLTTPPQLRAWWREVGEWLKSTGF
ncbi:MAG: peptidase S9 [Lysobacteraceae bacterium]|nr:MAG: peptidase S9 [Xanthomonadaceae bacterium]